jgi:hypothetical protein
MNENVLKPKYAKGKKPVRIRKPSRPIDGINHRLLEEQAAQAAKQEVAEQVPDDNAPLTRAEIEQKANELGIKFDRRTTDKKLIERIESALGSE